MPNIVKTIFRRYPVKTQRFLEILPGFVSWSLILFPFWGSFIVPELVAYYVIAYAVYWVYRSLTVSYQVTLAHIRIKRTSKIAWASQLKKEFPEDWDSIHHIIIIPTYKEPLTTLQRTLNSLAEQTTPLKQLHIMVSFEEREGEPAKEKAAQLEKEFGKMFGHVWTTHHPDIQGEIKGKSSNTSWGARRAKEALVDKDGIPIEKVTITSEDADALFHKEYFANLAYQFLQCPKPFNRIWQGGVMFYNNIWRVPTPIRVQAAMFSMFQIKILVQQERLINFSTYSTSMKLIEDIGYWDTDVIPEDYRLFFKAYFGKKGDLQVDPIYLPIYADAAEAEGLWNTLLNQYEQLKRWSWGVSDDAYIIRRYVLEENVPFWDKTLRVFKVVEDHFLWPVNWFAVTISAFLPPLLNPEFDRTILGKTLPQVISTLLTLSLISMIVIFTVDALNRPPRPEKNKYLSYILQPLEFLIMPLLGFFFSALPSLDAHTRLMMGKYIEYKVTEKV